jgi:hypothetical protein
MRILNPCLRITLLAASTCIMITGLSTRVQRKFDILGLIPNQYQFGDLYNVTNLKRFKGTQMGEKDHLKDNDKPVIKCKNVDVYTIGDSFTTMDTSFYAGNTNRHIWLGVNVDTVTLDPNKQSILIIEVIERTIQERLKPDGGRLYLEKGFQVKSAARETSKNKTGRKTLVSFWWEKFNDQINQRLEFLLFNAPFFLELKELKAALMLSWFDRTHPGAIISRDHRFLFYDIEANPESVLSPFWELADADIDTVVANMQSIRRHYQRLGFREVYFCFVPNKVTVCEPGRFKHNNQIARIESHPALQPPVLSIYKEVTRHPEWFHKSDGHWNIFGKRYWLRQVNELAYALDRTTVPDHFKLSSN